MADYNSAYTGAEIDQGVGNGLAAPTTYAPIAHDSTATTYGKGTDTKYGHLKLSSSTSSTSGTSGGIAATPSAVKAAYDLANGKQDPATTLAGYGITDAASSAELGTFVRPNLLDNAYFVGGGSQQGGGQFPINQRGATSYSTSLVYTIDRWLLNAGNTMACDIASDCVQLVRSGAGSYPAWLQIIETPEKYAGMKMTISALVKTSNGMPAQVDIKNTTGGGSAFASASITSSMTDWTLVSATGVFPENSTNLRVIWYVGNGTYSATLSIKAVKLELGSTQTLAHQENGTWVLNKVPNYQQELAKCQRFCYVWNTGGSEYASIGVGYTTSATEGRVVVPFPVTMRTNPTLTTTGSFSVGVGSNAYAVSSVAKEPTWSNTDGARLNLTLSSSATSGSPCIVRGNGSTAKLNFSADL